MKRERRPFVVEVKRGQKRAGGFPEPEISEIKLDSVKRAQDALFGGSWPVEASIATSEQEQRPESANVAPPRRILEAVAPDLAELIEIAPPRRGRKPGSKNKPKLHDLSVEPMVKRGRGRPRLNADSSVRKVAVTPEITSAALRKIATASQPHFFSKAPGNNIQPVPMFEPPPKRGRGRPRKIKPPKFDWTAWTSNEDGDVHVESAIVAPHAAAAPVVKPVMALPPLTGVTRFEGPRVRAGERWKRRLRMPVTVAGKSRSLQNA